MLNLKIHVYSKILDESLNNIGDLLLLKKQLLKCSLCKRLVQARREVLGENHYPLPFKSSGVGKIMLIGIAPGRLQCDRSKSDMEYAFKRGSGEILFRLFKELGLNEDIFHITNIIKCNTPRDGQFTKEEVNRCAALFLKEEIKLIDPILILLLGRQAEEHFTEYMSSDGEWYQYRFIYHPSAVLRGFTPYEKYKEMFVSQLKTIK